MDPQDTTQGAAVVEGVAQEVTTAEPTSEKEAQRRAFFHAKADLEQEIADKVQAFAANFATDIAVSCRVGIKATAQGDRTAIYIDSVEVTSTIGQKAN